jgi:hypothetical protein
LAYVIQSLCFSDLTNASARWVQHCITGDSKVFVPPTGQEDARTIDDLVDMDSVAEMDDDDTEELARSLQEQLVLLTPDVSGGGERELTCSFDAVDLACARSARPLFDVLEGKGPFRGPVELPKELAAVAERELGETPEVRTAALEELRSRLVQLETTGVGTKKKHRSLIFPRKDDQFLVCFLRARKFRVPDAEKVRSHAVSNRLPTHFPLFSR